MDRKKFTKMIVTTIFFLFVLNLLANHFYWYYSIWYFDMIMHTIGGLWVGLTAIYVFSTSRSFRLSLESKAPTGKYILATLLSVLLVGVLWEVFEVSIDKIIIHNSFNVLDTASDIFFDLFGGLCAIVYLWKKQQK